jgi:hypothetical protein
MMAAERTSETSDDNRFTLQYIPEDNSERRRLVYESYNGDVIEDFSEDAY